MRGVQDDGTFIQMSHRESMAQGLAPVNPMENMPLFLHSLNASTMLGEFPDVEMPINTSPSQPWA